MQAAPPPKNDDPSPPGTSSRDCGGRTGRRASDRSSSWTLCSKSCCELRLAQRGWPCRSTAPPSAVSIAGTAGPCLRPAPIARSSDGPSDRHHVADHESFRVLAEDNESGLSRVAVLEEALRRGAPRHRLPQGGWFPHHRRVLAAATRAAVAGLASPSLTGTRMLNVVPFPGSERTWMWPPACLTMPYTTASPSPVPDVAAWS